MNVQLNTLENSRVELIIKVENKEFVEAINKSFKKNVGKYNVPGFRRGKVPFNVFKKMFGVESLYNDAVNILIDKTYRDAIQENKLEVVDYPEIDLITCDEEKDLEYKAVVYVKPEVKLGEYKGVKVDEVKYDLSQEDVERELNSMREENSRLISKESGLVEQGDIAVIDFKGFIDEIPFEGGEGKDYSLAIGSKTFIDNFEDQLVGKKKDEEVVVNVTFPEDYNVEELKGKPAKFEVKINDVKIKEFPELDDEFAKSFSEFETLDELKKDISEKLETSNSNRAKAEYENAVIEKVCENAEVYIPDPMINSEIDKLVKDFENKIRYQGINLDKYCEYYGITLEDIRNNFKDRASKQVLSSLVLEEISKREKMEITEEELDNKTSELAKLYAEDGDKIKSIKETLMSSYKDSLEKDILFSKTVEFLVNESKKESIK